ncbi:MAG: betaine/proline/choline family ABC transporter ATP-binding protein [Actinobacteria bacterium]|nr:betaine/proline/choline family ABC transporter ATP-binding protein [Actinomycetota bacterium]
MSSVACSSLSPRGTSSTSHMADVMISLKNVSKRFEGTSGAAVEDLSLDISKGETVVLVGPSGCGKTTTMKMINRLVEPTSGSITVDGTDVLHQDPVQLRRGIGYVIQSIGLMPHRNIADNIGMVPRLIGWDNARIKERINELVEIFQLETEMLSRYPSELSGGQRQRVGVARALAADPPVMLMDEPFAAVDPIVRERLQDQFLEIQARLRKTIVFVTHDIDEAVKLADRIAILNVGGVIEQYATPEEILREPANDFVRSFVGRERGLKRLALIKVADIETELGPLVAPQVPTSRAIAEMDGYGLDWVSIVDDGELLGWIDRATAERSTTVDPAEARPFSAYVTAESSLREALEAIATSRTQVAVVVTKGQRYRGILTLERISKEIIS